MRGDGVGALETRAEEKGGDSSMELTCMGFG